MRLSEYCSSVDIDRAIAVTVDSFVGSQKVSCKKALSRAFAKYVQSLLILIHFLFLSTRPILTSSLRYTLARPKPQSKRRAGIPASRGTSVAH